MGSRRPFWATLSRLLLSSLTVGCARSELELAEVLPATAATEHGSSGAGSGGAAFSGAGSGGGGSSGKRACAWGFAPPVTYPGGPAPSTVAVGDFDSDGHADIAVNNYAPMNSLQLLLNRGDGTFTVGTTLPSTVAFSMAVGPFISSHSDLLVGCDVFENDGRGNLAPAIDYGYRCGAQDSLRNLATGDFDGDGKLDLAWGFFNTAAVRLNRGNGVFAEVDTELSPDMLHVTTMTSADFDRDGIPDLATAGWGYGNPNRLDFLHGNGDGSFAVTSFDTGDTMLTSIAAGDMNGDGRADVVTTSANPNGLEVRLQEPDGSFAEPVLTVSGFVNPITLLGDINGDGASDVVMADENGTGLSYFLNTGDGTFGKQTFLAVDGSLWNAALGDLNGDGHLDIVAATAFASQSGYAEVWLSQCR
jgi:hypothetical protein